MRATKLFILLVAYLLSAGAAWAQLSRADAAKLLVMMGDTNVVVGTVVNGVGREGSVTFGSPSAALVTAYAERNGQSFERRITFYYDRDVGWFYSEVDPAGHRVRLWTLYGYKELKAGE